MGWDGRAGELGTRHRVPLGAVTFQYGGLKVGVQRDNVDVRPVSFVSVNFVAVQRGQGRHPIVRAVHLAIVGQQHGAPQDEQGSEV